MTFLSRNHAKHSRKTVVIAIVGTALVAIAAVTTTIAFLPGRTPAAEPAPTPTTTAPQLAPPETVSIAATFAAWTVEAADGLLLSAEAGRSPDGSTALLIDAPVTAAPGSTAVLSQSIAVHPGTEYELRAMARVDPARPSSGSVTLSVGSLALEVPTDGDDWTELTLDYATGAEETELRMGIAATGDVSGVRIDAISLSPLAAPGAGEPESIVANGSFEDFTAPTQLTNSTLVMPTGEAHIGVSWRTNGMSWTVRDETDAVLTSGELAPGSGLNLIPLGELAQGFYSLTLTQGDASAEPVTTAFMVLDEPDIAAGERDKRFGVGVHVERAYYDGSEAVAAQIGFAHMRTDARWSQIETVKGEYTYPDSIINGVQAFEAAGVDALPILGYGNKFHAPGAATDEAGVQAFTNFASDAVVRLEADAIEVYNEFNNPLLNKGPCGTTPDCYMPMLRATADRIHAEHPHVPIIGPATARKDDVFLTGLYQLGGLDYLDAVSFHPYDYDYDTNKGAEFLVESLKQAGDRIREYNDGETKPIWITELGWTTTLLESDRQQADYLVRAEVISLASNVERFYWYDLVNDHVHPLDHEGNFGLVRQKSAFVPVFEPKPAAMAQSMLIRKISGKEFALRDDLNDAAYSYAFGAGADATRVAWSTEPVTVSYAATEPVTVTTQYGEVSELTPKKGAITIRLGEQTVYLDGDLGPATVVG